MRSTKIVATLGPASEPIAKELVAASVNVFRLNFSHGSQEEHAARVSDILVLGDGLIELRVVATEGKKVQCQGLTGGELGPGKGINLRGGGLSAPALTTKDLEDLKFACSQSVDYIAVSFAQTSADLDQAKQLVRQAGADCSVIAKLERAEAVNTDEVLDAIINASDGVMVARGDLGIEIGDAALVGTQKRIIARARELNRCVITATQMMESMIANSQPTRAEVMDVANAVLDGTDAVMLSGETAVGKYPAETVAERLAGVRAVACFTATGNTPRLMWLALTCQFMHWQITFLRSLVSRCCAACIRACLNQRALIMTRSTQQRSSV